MKICVITKELYPFYYDGIGVQAHNQALLLAQNGHDVTWLSQVHTNYDEARAPALYPGISLEFFNYKPEKFLSHKPLDYAIQVEECFARLHAQKRFDAVLTFDFEAECFCICKKRLTETMYEGLKIIVTLEGPAREVTRVNQGVGTTPWDEAVFEAEDFSLLMSDAVIACSAYLWEQVSARLSLSRKPVKVIPNMCHSDLFKSPGMEINPRERQSPSLREIVFVGRLEKRKGADLLLTAFLDLLREDPRALDFKLVFVGRDLFWDDLKSSFIESYLPKVPEGLRKHFEFCGQLSHQDVALRLQKAVFGVFPSRWEPFGITALEALSSGLPVIVSRGTGLEEIVGKDYPFLFDLKEGVNGLKNWLKRAIDAEDQWASLSVLAMGIAKEVNRKSREDFLDFVRTIGSRDFPKVRLSDERTVDLKLVSAYEACAIHVAQDLKWRNQAMLEHFGRIEAEIHGQRDLSSNGAEKTHILEADLNRQKDFVHDHEEKVRALEDEVRNQKELTKGQEDKIHSLEEEVRCLKNLAADQEVKLRGIEKDALDQNNHLSAQTEKIRVLEEEICKQKDLMQAQEMRMGLMESELCIQRNLFLGQEDAMRMLETRVAEMNGLWAVRFAEKMAGAVRKMMPKAKTR